MDNPFSQKLIFDHSMTLRGKYERCVYIIDKYKSELPYLRRKLSTLDKQNKKIYEEALYWKRKYKEEKEKSKKLDAEVDQLKKEIDRLTKTNNRYRVSLFDHGNFTHTDSEQKKKKGGQVGHADTNREGQRDYSSYATLRIFAKTCGNCHTLLSRVASTKKKILLDIVIHPEIIKMIILSERQWCGNCKKEVLAKDPNVLPFTEYGINTFMMTMILRFSCHSSMRNISKVFLVGYGLTLSKSDVASLLKSGANYLGKKYEELKTAIREGEVMYNDETGWLVHGQKAWMWIMANDKQTVYFAAESRGGGIAKEMYGKSDAYTMTDGLASYTNAIPQEKHLYCWAHVLRFVFEETVKLQQDHVACLMRDKLVDLYQMIRHSKEWTREQKKKTLQKELDSILSIQSTDQTVVNILYRIKTQKEGLILALLVTDNGTNNLAERELRNIAIKRTISYGSDTYKGMETTAIIGSILQTLHRNREAPFIPTFKSYLQESIQEKYRQYIHTAYYDS